MITRIVIKNIASFGNAEVSIHTNKGVNLFYGLNGTGKSTIVRCIADSSAYTGKCKVEFSNNSRRPEILVYNEDFVEQNFLQKENQPGVFTLGQQDIEAEKAIETAELEIQKYHDDINTLLTEKQEKEARIDESKSKLQEKIFEIKRKHEKQTLDFCLEKYKTKERFYEKIIATPFENADYNFEHLEQEAREIDSDTSFKKNLLPQIEFRGTDYETNSIWTETIVASGDSYLKDLIDKIGHSDWVRDGQHLLRQTSGSCPFCQQPLPANFDTEIQKLFDQHYTEKTNTVSKACREYEKAIGELQKQLENQVFKDEYVTREADFQKLKEDLIDSLRENQTKMNEKMEKPGKQVTVEKTGSKLAALQQAVDSINKKIEAFNAKLDQKEEHRSEIKKKFWKLVRYKYNRDIDDFQSEEAGLRRDIRKLTEEIKAREAQIQQCENVIAENRRRITNVDQAVDRINAHIESLGLNGFQIRKVSDESRSYRIERPSATENVYKSLSEGEKTLITLLYFLELCGGSTDEDGTYNPEERIVVIDDPISSLSHNYIYDVAHLLRKEFFEREGDPNKKNRKFKLKISQLFILTHSLYFFHELIRLKFHDTSSGAKLFKVTKSEFSSVEEIGKNAIQNDYEAFWSLFHDCINNNASKRILPNVMRNILEFYFSFIHGIDKLEKALEELSTESQDFIPLYRYLNRGSHSDAINLSEFKNIDPQRYQEMFRSIFEKTGFLQHYEAMLEKAKSG